MSQHHARIKNDPRWHAARRACFERDGFACVRCSSTEKLQADHIIRISDDAAGAFDIDNLQTLCHSCHIEKEREYERIVQVRVEWVNPDYPELGFVLNKESEDETIPIL